MKEAGYLGHLRRADKVIHGEWTADTNGTVRAKGGTSASARNGSGRARARRAHRAARCGAGAQPQWKGCCTENYVRGLCVETRALILVRVFPESLMTDVSRSSAGFPPPL